MTDINTTVCAGRTPITINDAQDDYIVVGTESSIKTLCITGVVGGIDHNESMDDARRIAALWNACQNIPTERLEGRTIADYLASEAYLTGLAPSENGASIGLSGIGCQILAASFAGQFKGSGAINFLELRMEHPETGPMHITMQRTQGTTPAEQLNAVRAERDAMQKVLQKALDQLDSLNGDIDSSYKGDKDLIAEMRAAAKTPEK